MKMAEIYFKEYIRGNTNEINEMPKKLFYKFFAQICLGLE